MNDDAFVGQKAYGWEKENISTGVPRAGSRGVQVIPTRWIFGICLIVWLHKNTVQALFLYLLNPNLFFTGNVKNIVHEFHILLQLLHGGLRPRGFAPVPRCETRPPDRTTRPLSVNSGIRLLWTLSIVKPWEDETGNDTGKIEGALEIFSWFAPMLEQTKL